MSIKLLPLVTLAALSAAPAALAQEVDPIAATRLSAELFDLGQAQNDALLMIAAGKLRKQAEARVEVIDRAPERDGPAPRENPMAPLTWESMLDAASDLNPDDAQMAGLIDDIRAETTKGVRSGRVESYASIRAGGTDTYRPLEFSVGVYADVYVEGSGGADINLYIRDAQGRLVCSDTDISAIAYCGWQPDTAQAYSVEVLNKGRVASAYKLMTN
ncbi:hypothetical protein [Oceaniglobus trochenteri]|uniref:hypothetical protein n=1 Tax=Oceaniglobus trochenteri TaxID=2763260 RepID=UPI001D00155A|nr:hypothetical protein [Oceaniglobus trochenteri]